MTRLVVGVDAGGTGSRAVLADPSGTRVATAAGGGVNPRSSESDPAQTLTRLLLDLLSGTPGAAASVRAGVLALAGAGAAGRAAAARAAAQAWAAAALPGVPTVVPDVVAAHAAGSPRPAGTVLVAGTGAMAAAVAEDRVVCRADGHGWLLGDAGSGVWLGVRAARAALAALEGRGGQTALTAEVLRALAVDAEPADPAASPARREQVTQAVIAAVDRMRPVALGRLAPLVSEAAAAGDEVAAGIVAEAVGELVNTLAAVLRPGSDLVLAGSVLRTPGPVREGVRAAVLDRWRLPSSDAGDGAGGAAVLAWRGAGVAVGPTAHARLTTP